MFCFAFMFSIHLNIILASIYNAFMALQSFRFIKNENLLNRIRLSNKRENAFLLSFAYIIYHNESLTMGLF